MTENFILDLETIIADRKNNPKEGSYTTDLLNSGLDRILRKVGEETGEVIIAAKNKDKEELTNEVSDLIYHLLVLLQSEGLSLNDINRVLKSRHQR